MTYAPTADTRAKMDALKPDGKGRKNDRVDNKTRLELIPPGFTEGVGRILTDGAVKYNVDNWMRGIQYRRIIGAIKRHILAIERGEDVDPDTGSLHAYHAACGLAFLSYYQEHPEYAEFDDRVFAPSKDNTDAR